MNVFAAALSSLLARYVTGSLGAGLFAGQTNVELDRRLVVFNIQQLEEEMTDPRHFPAPVGRLAAERRGAEMTKRQFVFAAKWAASLGTALEDRQEVLAALADVAIEAYAMDSILGRTLATDREPQLRDALCRFYCMEARERAYDRARTAVAAVVPAEQLENELEQLARLHKYTPVNSAHVREEIVPALLDAGGYPFSY